VPRALLHQLPAVQHRWPAAHAALCCIESAQARYAVSEQTCSCERYNTR
jgi:hypothetical protein